MDRAAERREQIAAVRATARRFAQRELLPMVGTEGRDGDLARVPRLLGRAGEAGLVASADPSDAGHEHGVWGTASTTDGDAPSLAVLEELAVECAGFAACVHAAGLGAQELGCGRGGDGAAVALGSGAWRIEWEALERPPPGAPRVEGGRLSGEASFVCAAPRCERFVVYAADGEGWARVEVCSSDEGLLTDDQGPRTGLAALRVVQLRFDAVPLAASARLGPALPHAYLRRLLLGLAAIALGNARGALRAARRYAAERYQGGDRIARHPAVQLLLGDSATRIAEAAACVDTAAVDGRPPPTEALSLGPALWAALAAKLRVTRSLAQAASDCLQVLGGYGYMEEYRMEKRLRDALTLESMVVAPDVARLLCAAREGGER